MLEDIKKMLGINNTDFDMIIKSYISSAKEDLVMTGIAESKVIEQNPLIYSAIVSYVKSFIDIDNAELYQNAYALQKDALRHHIEYISEE